VTVLLSTHNDLRLLPQAVESILAQTLADFEFLIIDDGSTDGTAEYLAGVCGEDPRVRVLRNETNIGLTRSLNLGIASARGQYLARLDADDVSAPKRLERQAAFLERNADVGVVGSSRKLIDEHGTTLGYARAVTNDLGIRWKSLLGNPFAHPSVMIRRDVLVKHRLSYNESYRTAQDYELWPRVLRHVKGANLEEPLLRYRLRQGVSRTSRADQLRNHDAIALSAIRTLLPGFPIDIYQVTELRGRYGGHSVREAGMDPADSHWAGKYLALLDAFCAAHRHEPGVGAFRRRQEESMPVPAAA
jgi:glycosyltransferase involved in cell wall biosynthesis